jgi:hypothetical protein
VLLKENTKQNRNGLQDWAWLLSIYKSLRFKTQNSDFLNQMLETRMGIALQVFKFHRQISRA